MKLLENLLNHFLVSFNSTADLLRYNYHKSFVTDVNEVFNWFRCSTCDKFFTSIFRRSSNIKRHLSKCVKIWLETSTWDLLINREVVFDKLKTFDIEATEDKLFFTNFAVFDFEASCLNSKTVADTETTARVGKHEPILVSIA